MVPIIYIYCHYHIYLLMHTGSSISSSSVAYAGYGNGPIFSYKTNCRGSEVTLNECRLTRYSYSRSYCNHFRDVTLNCIGNFVVD